MIALLKGTLAYKSPGIAIIDVGGVGYETHIPLTTYYDLPDEGAEVSFHIHTHVREDAITLFGFTELRDKSLFLLLLGISGVGPKVALGIISGLPYDALVGAITTADERLVATIPGVGKKTAARIVLELKDKVQSLNELHPVRGRAASGVGASPEREEAVSALVNLGYKKPAAEMAVRKACGQDGDTPPLDELIRGALNILSGG